MKVVWRSLLSLFTMKVLLYEIPIASWDPVLESCASRTFKLYKEKFYSSNIKVVTRSLLSFFTLKVLLYEFPIASWNLVIESCASTTLKHCKNKFYSSYMKVATRSLLSFFTSNVLLYKIPITGGNLALESCATTTFNSCKDKSFFIHKWKLLDDLCYHYSLWKICYMSFQSRAGISWWNHALAQHWNLVKRSFILRIWKL